MLKLAGGMVCVPMQDESNCDHYAHANANQWVYTLDGKKHGKIPAVVLPGLVHIWGGESAIRKAGYRKHWCVFIDDRTGRTTFGNYRSFINGGLAERAIAEAMMQVNISDLMKL